MKKLAFTLLMFLVLLPLVSHAADVTLMPVSVQLNRSNDRATVQVMNNGSQPVIMQAEAIAWTRVDGKDIDGATSDIIVNPPVFTVQPGQTQIVRLGLRRSQDLQQEGTYRMVLREVPGLNLSDIGNVSGSVRVLVALRVPIYVAPTRVVREERWQLRQDGDGHMVASISNAGNVHVKVSELRLQGAGTDGMVIEQKGPNAVLFPGEERSFKLSRVSPADAKSATLQVTTDQGLQQIAYSGQGSSAPR